MFSSREVKMGEMCILKPMKYVVQWIKVRVNKREDKTWKITRQPISFIICPLFKSLELYSLADLKTQVKLWQSFAL